jgi:hypothetical protein
MKHRNRDCLALKEAIDLLHFRGATLMRSHGDDEFYVVPGGRVARNHVDKLFQRCSLVVDSGGLFPGNPQTWIVSRRE